MIKKALLAATAASLVAIPGTASAQYYPGYGYGGYNDGYYGQRYDHRRRSRRLGRP